MDIKWSPEMEIKHLQEKRETKTVYYSITEDKLAFIEKTTTEH